MGGSQSMGYLGIQSVLRRLLLLQEMFGLNEEVGRASADKRGGRTMSRARGQRFQPSHEDSGWATATGGRVRYTRGTHESRWAKECHRVHVRTNLVSSLLIVPPLATVADPANGVSVATRHSCAHRDACIAPDKDGREIIFPKLTQDRVCLPANAVFLYCPDDQRITKEINPQLCSRHL
jgi:hypothetical protein